MRFSARGRWRGAIASAMNAVGVMQSAASIDGMGEEQAADYLRDHAAHWEGSYPLLMSNIRTIDAEVTEEIEKRRSRIAGFYQ